MKGLLLLSLILFSIILLSINAGDDNQIINETSITINHEIGSCECVHFKLCENKDFTITRDNNESCDDSFHVCCEQQHIVKVRSLSLAPTNDRRRLCGIRNKYGVGFLVYSKNSDLNNDNNTKAKFGEFPWMVAVLSEETVEGSSEKLPSYRCGASLIHQQVVLTSANCVNSKDKKLSIRAGEWDSQNNNEDLPHQDRNVENIIIHSDFNIKTLDNDVALLILDEPIHISGNVDIVCLPPQNEVVLQNATCFYTSWNKDTFDKKGIPSDILNKERLPIIQQDDCQERLRRTRLGNKFVLYTSSICSGKEDTCNGSGGSPLVCSIPGKTNQFYQSGITSWGLGCVETPIVYSNVASFRNWIDNEMLKLNYNISIVDYIKN